jgi:mono/diheme cytochrome c family protein
MLISGRGWRSFRTFVLTALSCVVAGLAVLWFMTLPQVVPDSALPPYNPNLDNGKTMFNIGGCASCHAVPNDNPDKVDRLRLGGGLALKSPFGTFYVPNISSDPKDGIGSWSEANFVTALSEGTSEHGNNLFPAFPYTSYAHMQINDIRDLFAYLKTLPPVPGKSPPHGLSFPFNQRALLGGWKLLFFHGGPFQPDPTKSAQWLSGERARPLRRMPFAAQFSRRHHREPAFRRRSGAGRQRLGVEHHPAWAARRRKGVVGERHRELSRRRHDA